MRGGRRDCRGARWFHPPGPQCMQPYEASVSSSPSPGRPGPAGPAVGRGAPLPGRGVVLGAPQVVPYSLPVDHCRPANLLMPTGQCQLSGAGRRKRPSGRGRRGLAFGSVCTGEGMLGSSGSEPSTWPGAPRGLDQAAWASVFWALLAWWAPHRLPCPSLARRARLGELAEMIEETGGPPR